MFGTGRREGYCGLRLKKRKAGFNSHTAVKQRKSGMSWPVGRGLESSIERSVVTSYAGVSSEGVLTSQFGGSRLLNGERDRIDLCLVTSPRLVLRRTDSTGA